jgi:hypothetical protein
MDRQTECSDGIFRVSGDAITKLQDQWEKKSMMIGIICLEEEFCWK